MAALLLQRVLIALRKVWVDLFPITRYDCADQTRGPGCLRHGLGHRVDDKRAHNQQAWEHTSVQCEPGRQLQHTLYGPYMNDFGSPGYHRVRFRVFGSGFQATNDPVVVLDVIQAPFGGEKIFNMIGQRVVRAKELKPSYRWFSVVCYPAGTGVYEYRCSVVQEHFDAKRHTLKFDEVRVHRYLPGWQLL